ncbi:unnamed protein product [Blepharisma stoltei]|uniref:C2H2-type domain-containing protein n=1 Tax=Blepharisma stoltei TaxID=1481888 RepID=A0AAU9JAE0_9CILI|nr:unnamed protein product [Blepharisma stoltei]
MVSALEFYTYGLIIYIPTAFILSFLFSLCKASARVEEPVIVEEVKENPKEKIPKGKKGKIIPPGKVALCKCCNRYLTTDPKLVSHEEGQKHKQKAAGFPFKGEWYSIVDEEKMKQAQAPQPKAADNKKSR